MNYCYAPYLIDSTSVAGFSDDAFKIPLPLKLLPLELTSKAIEAKDSNGNTLNNGDSVHVIKDLKVKGMPTTLKRGNVIKNTRLTNSPDEVECRIGKSQVVLKTMYLKKA